MFYNIKKIIVHFSNQKKILWIFLSLFLSGPLYCCDEDLSTSHSSPKVVKILSIDGGGVKGMIPATILAYLSKQTGKEVHEMFDIIGGSSAGGTICTLSATPLDNSFQKPVVTAEELPAFFYNESKNLLKQNWFPCLSSLYNVKSAEKVALKYFGNKEFDKSLVPTVLTTFDYSKLQLKLIESWNQREIFYTKDVTLATAAVPFIFPMRKISPINSQASNVKYNLGDGGITDNDPTAHVIAAARSLYPNAEKFEVFSLGTGNVVGSVTGLIENSGLILGLTEEIANQWFKDQSYRTQDYIREQFNGKHWRLNPTIPTSNASLENTDLTNLKSLQEITGKYIQSLKSEFEIMVEHLKTPKYS